jgi:hypothetical protein
MLPHNGKVKKQEWCASLHDSITVAEDESKCLQLTSTMTLFALSVFHPETTHPNTSNRKLE